MADPRLPPGRRWSSSASVSSCVASVTGGQQATNVGGGRQKPSPTPIPCSPCSPPCPAMYGSVHPPQCANPGTYSNRPRYHKGPEEGHGQRPTKESYGEASQRAAHG